MPKQDFSDFVKGSIFFCGLIAAFLGHDLATACNDACTTGSILAPPVGRLRAESGRTGGNPVPIPPGTAPGRSCPGPGAAGGPRLPPGLCGETQGPCGRPAYAASSRPPGPCCDEEDPAPLAPAITAVDDPGLRGATVHEGGSFKAEGSDPGALADGGLRGTGVASEPRQLIHSCSSGTTSSATSSPLFRGGWLRGGARAASPSSRSPSPGSSCLHAGDPDLTPGRCRCTACRAASAAFAATASAADVEQRSRLLAGPGLREPIIQHRTDTRPPGPGVGEPRVSDPMPDSGATGGLAAADRSASGSACAQPAAGGSGGLVLRTAMAPFAAGLPGRARRPATSASATATSRGIRAAAAAEAAAVEPAARLLLHRRTPQRPSLDTTSLRHTEPLACFSVSPRSSVGKPGFYFSTLKSTQVQSASPYAQQQDHVSTSVSASSTPAVPVGLAQSARARPKRVPRTATMAS